MTHKPKLDSLRAIAIILVLLEHFGGFVPGLIHAGYVGVDLFFTLSGFLITKILYESKGSVGFAFKRFFMRRVLRIFPIYYSCILFLILLKNPDVFEHLKYLLTYTYNYAIPIFNIQGPIFFHFWSLSVEEQFYIFWPFIILSFRNNSKGLIIIITAIILLSYFQLQFNLFGISQFNYFGVFPRSYSLGIGGLGAILYCNKRFSKSFFQSKVQEWIMLFAGLLVLMRYGTYDFLILMPIISVYWVLKAYHGTFENNNIDRFFTSSPLQKVGIISYGIYIFHLPVVHYTIQPVFDYLWLAIPFENYGILSKIEWHPWILQFPLYSGVAYYFANLSYKYFERPILSLKDKYFK